MYERVPGQLSVPGQRPTRRSAAVREFRNGPHGEHRPAPVKTGTASDARHLATYGYLAPPTDPSAPAYAVGIWMGNSDHSFPHTAKPAIWLTAAPRLWRAFVRDLTFPQPSPTPARTLSP